MAVLFLTVSLGMHGASLVAQGKESSCRAGDPGLIPGLGRSPREGNGNPLQCPCLENPMERGAWWAAVHGVTKSWGTTEQLTLTYLLGHALLRVLTVNLGPVSEVSL